MLADPFSPHMEALARDQWGEPNPRLSTKSELRWGTYGSKSIDLTKGAWFDHEANEGGGVLAFLEREMRLVNGAALDHLKTNYGAELGERRPQPHGPRAARAQPPRRAQAGSPAPAERKRIVAEYDYVDEHGEVLFQAIRFEPKTFAQRRPATAADRMADQVLPEGSKPRVRGDWVWSIEGVRQVPYRLPELYSLEGRGRVFLAEGEKDVDRLIALGAVASCNAMGSGKWPDELSEHFTGLDVVILPDNDDAGEKHVRTVAPALTRTAATVRVLRLPDLAEKGDVTDWLEAGGDLDRLNKLAEATPIWTPNARKAKPTDTFPPELLEVPGLVGVVAKWINSTALYPQPVLALAAALVVVGTAAGRRVAGPTESGTHLYVLSLAKSGAGKNHAPKMAGKLMRAAGMEDHVGPIAFSAGSAVWDTVSKEPLLACFMDEFGNYLARVNSRDASGHERGVSAVLRQLWGASYETLMPQAWASTSTRTPKPIHAPAVSIFGISNPEGVLHALTGADVSNGFLNRFLLLATDDKPEEADLDGVDTWTVPEKLAAAVGRLYGGGVCNSKTVHQNGVDRAEVKVDWASAEVRLAARAWNKELQGREGESLFLARTNEMALRLATIRAAGTSLERPMIDAAGWEWAKRVALWSADRMIHDASLHMVENEHQKQVRMVERIIREAGQLTRSELTRKIDGRLPRRMVDDIVSGLIEGGSVEEEALARAPGARGPKPTAYRMIEG